jgi:aminoglycoside phosphotransferase (APT) family kinase protein
MPPPRRLDIGAGDENTESIVGTGAPNSDLETFRRGVTRGEVERIVTTVFDAKATVIAMRELPGGMYNSTWVVETQAYPEPVVLRVAPDQHLQFRSEWQLMRNEYAVQPFVSAALSGFLPRVIAADWSHQVIDRDYMVLSMLPGVPAREALDRYPRPTWAAYFEQMGGLAKRVHAVAGDRFGTVAAPAHNCWSGAFLTSMSLIAQDSARCGLSRAVVDEIHSIAADNAPMLDQVTSASLLTGDLWTTNVLLSADNDEYPEITGVVDLDRAEWGDPLADWAIWMARKKPGTERDSFWSGYGALAEEDPSVRFRLALYAARHQAAVRLENARLADAAGVQDGSQQLARSAESLQQMAAG